MQDLYAGVSNMKRTSKCQPAEERVVHDILLDACDKRVFGGRLSPLSERSLITLHQTGEVPDALTAVGVGRDPAGCSPFLAVVSES